MSEQDRLPPVLDPVQLVRIEATHRGFAYQHLYAVACLLDMEASGTDTVIVEHDEDVELVRAGSHLYVQVKTRNRAFQFSDLESALERFADLRDAHSEGQRTGTAQFALVCNAEPGPGLRERLAADTWPTDVVLLHPGNPGSATDLRLPVPWPDLGAAIQACAAQAALVPFSSLTPETLVLKLAGLVQYLATGHAGHAVTQPEVRVFFEQLVIQLQDFPKPPEDYRPHDHEPSLHGEGRVRLLVGVSGVGKTVWASHQALTDPSPVAYFDVGELPGSALALSLARELTARFLADLDSAVLPIASGLELLAWVSRRLTGGGRETTVVLDNAHRISADALREVMEAAVGIRFVVLAQPWAGQAEIEARLGILAEKLDGWPLDTVVAAFAAAGCPIGAAVGRRLLGLTGGFPLYVNNAARLATDAYAGEANAFLNAVEQRLNLASTAQEVILNETFGRLTAQAQTAAALLELSDVVLDNDEALELIGAAGASAVSSAAAVRELGRWGVVERFQGGGVKLHDVFRIVARDARPTIPAESLDSARQALVMLLQRSLPMTLGRFGLWVRLLPQIGRLDMLVNLATYEQFHQMGDRQELKATVESAVSSPSLSDEDHFWALDALIYWEYNEGLYDRIQELVSQLTDLAERAELDANAQAELSMKQMLTAALANDRERIDSAYSSGLQHVRQSPETERILSYNYASSLYGIGAYEDAVGRSLALVAEYYNLLGLDVDDVLFANVDDLLAKIPDTHDRDDILRHTGDCLYLLARAQQGGQPPGRGSRRVAMAYLHAMKFYHASSAWRSAVHAGQNAVDELIAIGDPRGARNICEGLLLPVVTGYQLSDLLVPVRSQYAVVLAWCGEFEDAREEISRLEAYQVSEIGSQELANQRALIEQIAASQSGPSGSH